MSSQHTVVIFYRANCYKGRIYGRIKESVQGRHFLLKNAFKIDCPFQTMQMVWRKWLQIEDSGKINSTKFQLLHTHYKYQKIFHEGLFNSNPQPRGDVKNGSFGWYIPLGEGGVQGLTTVFCQNYHLLVLLLFDPEAFKTFKKTKKLFSLHVVFYVPAQTLDNIGGKFWK